MQTNQQFKSATECYCCYQNFDDEQNIPRILTKCGHTICSKCIKSIITLSMSSYAKSIRCPLCKQEHEFHGNELSTLHSFPVNQQLFHYLSECKRERANSRANILKKDREHYCCSLHQEEVSLFIIKTKEFLCASCFSEQTDSGPVLKIGVLFDEAPSKSTKLINDFKQIKEYMSQINDSQITAQLLKQKEKLIKGLQSKATRLKEMLDYNFNREIAEIEKSFSKLEYLMKKEGIFGYNLEYKIDQSVPKLEQVCLKLASGCKDMESLRSLHEQTLFNFEPIDKYFGISSKQKSFKEISDMLISKLKKDCSNFLAIESENPLRFSINPSKIFKKFDENAKIIERNLFIKNNSFEKTRSFLCHMAFADAITGLDFKSCPEECVSAKFTLVGHDYEYIVNLLAEEPETPC
jgi:hypothetical protein